MNDILLELQEVLERYGMDKAAAEEAAGEILEILIEALDEAVENVAE